MASKQSYSFSFFLLTCLAIILTGCGTTQQTDVTGLCGSCKPYYVRGSMHYPQRFYEYDEVGLASWYGPGFHGKPKPLGEKFDQNTMTAAHKTLPLPTVVRVTSLENGKSIVVVVDDRGPFVYEGRIIDLSVEAAKRLGSYSKGVAKVRVQSMIKESKQLSDYLAKHGHQSRKDPMRRTWIQIFEQEILKQTPIRRYPDERSASQQKKASPAMYQRLPAIKTKANLPSAMPRFLTVRQTYKTKLEATKALKMINKAYPARMVPELQKGGKTAWRIKVGPLNSSVKPADVKSRIESLVRS